MDEIIHFCFIHLEINLFITAAAAAAAAKSSVVSNPHRQQPTRLLRPWDSPGKNTGVGCHFLLQCMKVKSLSHIRLLAAPWTAAYQAPPFMGFFRQEYLSGLPFPSPLITASMHDFSNLKKQYRKCEG